MNKQQLKWDIETLEGTIGVIPYEEMERDALERVIAYLKQQLTDGWIPASERLPEDGSDVLLTLKRKSDGIVYIGVCYRWENENWDFAEPLAWQPLPEPYKEE